jgi:hypothetical protein
MSDTRHTASDIGGDGDELPTLVLPQLDACTELLQTLQVAVLRHPIAAKALFGLLVAEGRAFAETIEGRVWQEKLAQSELLHRARLVLDLPALAILESTSPQALPSAYLDTIFALACSRQPGRLLTQLFEWGSVDGRE